MEDRTQQVGEALTELMRINATEVSCPSLRELNYIVLADPAFQSGYGARSHHHNYVGGLVVHTYEVFMTCMAISSTNPQLNRNVLATAAIWHDYLKMRDYTVGEDGKPAYTEYKEHIYHIAGSMAEFYHAAKLAAVPTHRIDSICHCILAHHGRPEWGSAISPKTPEALTLHYADCMSAWFEHGGYKEKAGDSA